MSQRAKPLALDTGAFSERHMRQRAAVPGFRINELNAAAPVLLTMTRTGALGAKKATSGLSAPARAIKPRKVGSGHPGRGATLVALRAPCAPR